MPSAFTLPAAATERGLVACLDHGLEGGPRIGPDERGIAIVIASAYEVTFPLSNTKSSPLSVGLDEDLELDGGVVAEGLVHLCSNLELQR